MVKQTIQVYARLKPTKAKVGLYDLDEDDDGYPRLQFNVPRELASGFINNKKEIYKFRFQKVFDQFTKQDEVFDHVAKPVIDNVLTGYNGTIFAYGQTGSGKTFTITGGAEKYLDRGIIPRTLSYIFEHMGQQSTDISFTVHISYLEIYNESGYDLLDPKHEAAKLEDLPKVALMEDSDQNIHLKNLTVHQATNEEEALNLLFLGDTNRMIAETPMNQASTRSHCIFTIHLTSRETGSATIRRAKCHLVDLAGSERVSKTGANGLLLTEAKYINLSLHYLEQVIVALSEKSRSHIPYRNSMMTSVLRDSLGGNCMTSMIATCAVDKRNLDETISTCRFAQRVALIKNDALLNEELDPKLMIVKLKNEIKGLKDELAMATGEQRTDDLSEEDLERCQEAVNNYLEDMDSDATLSIGGDMRKIQQCYRILKKIVLEKPKVVKESPPPRPETPPDTGPYSTAENKKLKELVQQRDNEINILVGMLKKEKKRAAEVTSELEKSGGVPPRSAPETAEAVNGHSRNRQSYSTTDMSGRKSSSESWSKHREKSKQEKEEKVKAQILGDMSIGRQEAFEIFRRDYHYNQDIEDNKKILKRRYTDAKLLGQSINQTRDSVNKIRGQIEHHRMQIAMQGLVDSNNPEPDEVEQDLRYQIEEEKSKYKETFNKLRHIKTEIEHLQHYLEKAKLQLMKDFELWWAEQTTAAQEQQNAFGIGGSRSAWNTPPVTPQDEHEHLESGDLNRHSTAYRLQQTVTNDRRMYNGAESRGYDSQRSSNSRNSQRLESRTTTGGIPLTGDPKADADIMAFVKARQNILKHAHQGNR